MSYHLLLVGILCLLSLGAGYLVAPRPPAELLTTSPRQQEVPSFEPREFQLGLAVAEIEKRRLPQELSLDTVSESEAPQLNVPEQFRREVTAVVRDTHGATIWLIDSNTGERRVLRRGSLYLDNWTVASVGEQSVTLRSGVEEHLVSLPDPSRAP